jgi:hypothetical protein
MPVTYSPPQQPVINATANGTITAYDIGANSNLFGADASFLRILDSNFGKGTYSYTIPAGVSNVYIIASGAGGGGGGFDVFPGADGLEGHLVQGKLDVTPGDTLDIYLGGGGRGGASNVKGKGGGAGGEYPGSTIFDSINLVGTGSFIKASRNGEMPDWYNTHSIWTSSVPFSVNTQIYFPESTYYEVYGGAYVTGTAHIRIDNTSVIDITEGEGEEYGGNRPYHKASIYVTQGNHYVKMDTTSTSGVDEPPGFAMQIKYAGYSGGNGGDASSSGSVGAGGGGGAASLITQNGSKVIVAAGGGGAAGGSRQGSGFLQPTTYVSSGTIKGGDAIQPDKIAFNLASAYSYSNGYNVLVGPKRYFPEISQKVKFSDTIATFGLQEYGSWSGSFNVPGNNSDWTFLHDGSTSYTAEMWFKSPDKKNPQQLLYTNGKPDNGVGGLWFGLNDHSGGSIQTEPIFDSLDLVGVGGIVKADNHKEMGSFYNDHSVWHSTYPFNSSTSVFFPESTYYKLTASAYVGTSTRFIIDGDVIIEITGGEKEPHRDDGGVHKAEVFLTAGYHTVEIQNPASNTFPVSVDFKVSRDAADEDRLIFTGPSNSFTLSNYQTGTISRTVYPETDYELSTYGSGPGNQYIRVSSKTVQLDDRKPGGDGDYNDLVVEATQGTFFTSGGKNYYRLEEAYKLDEPNGVSLLIEYKDPPTSTVNLYFYDGTKKWQGFYTNRNVWAPNVWNHIAFVFDVAAPNAPKLFINGTEESLSKKTLSGWTGYNSTLSRTPLIINGNGRLSVTDVRITKEKVYTSGFARPTDVLPVYNSNTYFLTCQGDDPQLFDATGNISISYFTNTDMNFSYRDFPYIKYLGFDTKTTGQNEWYYRRTLTSNTASLIYNYDRLKYEVNRPGGGDWGDPPEENHNDILELQYSVDGSTNWKTLDTVTPNDLKSNKWETRTVVIPPEAADPNGVYLRFVNSGLLYGDLTLTRDCYAISNIIASLSDDFGGSGGGGGGQLGGASGITGISGNYSGHDGEDLLPAGFTSSNTGSYGGEGAKSKKLSSGYGTDGYYIIGVPLNKPANTGVKSVFGNDYPTHNWPRAVAKKEPKVVYQKIYNDGKIFPDLFTYVDDTYVPGLVAYYVDPNGTTKTIKDSTWRPDPAPATFIGDTQATKFPGTEFPCIYVPSGSKEGAVVHKDTEKLKLVKSPSSSLTIEAMIYWLGQGTNSHDPYGGTIVNKDSEYQLTIMKDGTIAFSINWGIGRANDLDGSGWIITDVKVAAKALTHIALVIDKTEAIIYINGNEEWRASIKGYKNKSGAVTYYNIDRQAKNDGKSLYIGARLLTEASWITENVTNTLTRTYYEPVEEVVFETVKLPITNTVPKVINVPTTTGYKIADFLKDNPTISLAAVNRVLPLYTGSNRVTITDGVGTTTTGYKIADFLNENPTITAAAVNAVLPLYTGSGAHTFTTSSPVVSGYKIANFLADNPSLNPSVVNAILKYYTSSTRFTFDTTTSTNPNGPSGRTGSFIGLNRQPDKGGLLYWSKSPLNVNNELLKAAFYDGIRSTPYDDYRASTTGRTGGFLRTSVVGDFIDVPDTTTSSTRTVTFYGLNRQPDKAGLLYWAQQVQKGVTGAALLEAFYNGVQASPYGDKTAADLGRSTFLRKTTVGDFIDVPDTTVSSGSTISFYSLNRQPDKDGLAYWAGKVQQENLSGNELYKQFFGGAQATPYDDVNVSKNGRATFLRKATVGDFIDVPDKTTYTQKTEYVETITGYIEEGISRTVTKLVERTETYDVISPVRKWVNVPTYYQVFYGYIGAVRLWNYARTATQIKDHVYSLAPGGGYYKLKPTIQYDLKFSDFGGKTASFPLYKDYKFFYKGNAGTDEKTTITPGLKIKDYLPYYPSGSWFSVDVSVPTSIDPTGSVTVLDTQGYADGVKTKIVGSKQERTDFLYRSGLWNANGDLGVFDYSNTITIATGGTYKLDMEMYSYQGGSFFIDNTAVLSVGTIDPNLTGEAYNIGSHEDLEGKIYSTEIPLDPGTYNIRIFANNYISDTGGWKANSATTVSNYSIGTIGGFIGTANSDVNVYGLDGFLNGKVSYSMANGITVTVDRWLANKNEIPGRISAIPGYVTEARVFNNDPINYGGTGYDANVSISFYRLVGGVLQLGNAAAVGVVNTSTGKIDSVILTNRGSGFTSNPTLTTTPPAAISIKANTQGWSNTTNEIYVTNANKRFQKGDIVYYYVPNGNTAITGMASGSITSGVTDPNGNLSTRYLKYVFSANSTALVLTNSPNGAPLDITSANVTSNEVHYLQGRTVSLEGTFSSVFTIAPGNSLFKNGIINPGDYYNNANYSFSGRASSLGARVSIDRIDPTKINMEIWWSNVSGKPFNGKKIATITTPITDYTYIKPTPYNEPPAGHEPPAVAAKLSRVPLWDPTGAGNPHGFFEVFRFYFPVTPVRNIAGKDYYVIAYEESGNYNKHIAYYMSRFPNNAIFSANVVSSQYVTVKSTTGNETLLLDQSSNELLIKEEDLLKYYTIGLPTGYSRVKKLSTKTNPENTAPSRYKKLKGKPIVRYSSRFNFDRDPATGKRKSGKVRVYYNYQTGVVYATWHYDGEIASPLNEAQVILTKFDFWPPGSMNSMNNLGNGTSFVNLLPKNSLYPYRIDGGFEDTGNNPVKILDLSPNTTPIFEKYESGHFQYRIPSNYSADKIYIEGSGAGGGAGGLDLTAYGYPGSPGQRVGGYVNVVPGDVITMHIGGGGQSGVTTSGLVNELVKKPIGTIGGFASSANTDKNVYGDTGFLNGKVSLSYDKGLTFTVDKWSADFVEGNTESIYSTIDYITIISGGTGYTSNAEIKFTNTRDCNAYGIVNTKTGKIDTIKIYDYGRKIYKTSTGANTIVFNLDPPPTISVKANTQGFSNSSDVIYVLNANTRFQKNDRVYYSVPAGNTTIRGLTPNSYYYVSFANTTSMALSTSINGSNVDITSNLRATLNFNIKANTQGFSNTTDVLYIQNANSYLTVNDRLYYKVPAGNTTIKGITPNNYYYVTFANSSAIAISPTVGGANVDITSGLRSYVNIPFIANTKSFSNTINVFYYNNANTVLTVDDRLYYFVPKNSKAITGLVANSYYYVSYTNSSVFAITDTLGGYTIPIPSANITSKETHYFIGDNSNEVHTLSGENSNEIHYIYGDTANVSVKFIPEYTIASAKTLFDGRTITPGRYIGDAEFAAGNKKSIIGAEVKLKNTNVSINLYHGKSGDPFTLDPVNGQDPFTSISIPIDVVNHTTHIGAGGFSSYNLTGGKGSKGFYKTNNWINKGTAKSVLNLTDILDPKGNFSGFYVLITPGELFYDHSLKTFRDDVPLEYFVILDGQIVYHSYGAELNPWWWHKNWKWWLDNNNTTINNNYWWAKRLKFDPVFTHNHLYRPGTLRKSVLNTNKTIDHPETYILSYDLIVNGDVYHSTNGGAGGGAGTIVFKNTSNNIPQSFSSILPSPTNADAANAFRDKLLFIAGGGGGGGGAGQRSPGLAAQDLPNLNSFKGGDGLQRTNNGGGGGGGGGGYYAGAGGLITSGNVGGYSGESGNNIVVNQSSIPYRYSGPSNSIKISIPEYDANTYLGKNFSVLTPTTSFGGNYKYPNLFARDANNGVDGYVVISRPLPGNINYSLTAFDSKGNTLISDGKNVGEREIFVGSIRKINKIAPFPKTWKPVYGDTIAAFGYIGPSLKSATAYSRVIVSNQPVDLRDNYSVTYMVNKGTANDWGQIPERNEPIYLQYSSNVASTVNGLTSYSTVWTTLDVVKPTDVANNVWVTRTLVVPEAAKTATNTYIRFIHYRAGGDFGPRDTWAVTNIVSNNVPIYLRPDTLGGDTGKIAVPSNLIHVEFLNNMVGYMTMNPYEGIDLDKKTLVKMTTADIDTADNDVVGSITLDNDKEI